MDNFEINKIGRFMDAFEEGNVPFSEASEILQKLDPLMSYFVLRFLREKYPARSDSSGASARLVSFFTEYDYLAKCANLPKGERAMQEWFEDSYSMRDFFQSRDQYLQTILEKIEG